MGVSLARSHQLRRGVGVGYRDPITPKPPKMNELDQCHSRMVLEKFWEQVLTKWEPLKDTRSEQKITDFDRNFIKNLRFGLRYQECLKIFNRKKSDRIPLCNFLHIVEINVFG